jgi:hypothetical protein
VIIKKQLRRRSRRRRAVLNDRERHILEASRLAEIPFCKKVRSAVVIAKISQGTLAEMTGTLGRA